MNKTAGFVKTNDGVRLYYEETGSGKPMVLIHGGGMSLVWWQRQIPVLSQMFRVIAFDTRGNGRSDKPAWGHRTARYAKDVYDAIEALGLFDVTLVGWSIGARTILSYLELFGGHRLRGVVLVDEVPSIEVHAPAPPASEPEPADEAERRRRSIAGIFAPDNAQNLTEAEFDWMVAESLKTSSEKTHTLGADYQAQDWRPLLPTIDVPTLVITGQQSGAYPGCLYMVDTHPQCEIGRM